MKIKLLFIIAFAGICACTKKSNSSECTTVNVNATAVNLSASALTGKITVTQPIGSDYTYSINSGTYQASPEFLNLASGSYTVTAKNTAGCTWSAVFNINVDESGYAGTYIGKHYLADSVNLRIILGGTEDMIYTDTLIITDGSSNTDGKLNARSALLRNDIELDMLTGNVTPVYIGDFDILATTLKDTRINSGSTATWNGSKTILTTHLTTSVTYIFGSTPVPISPLIINGTFQKQ